MSDLPDGPRLAGATLALLLLAPAALADRRASDGRGPRAELEGVAPREAALRAEALRRLPPAAAAVADPVSDTRGSRYPRFPAPTDLGHELRYMQQYSVLRLWDTPRVRVFLGLDRAGRAGLHFLQRDPRDWPFREAAAAPFHQPIRVVPLISP